MKWAPVHCKPYKIYIHYTNLSMWFSICMVWTCLKWVQYGKILDSLKEWTWIGTWKIHLPASPWLDLPFNLAVLGDKFIEVITPMQSHKANLLVYRQIQESSLGSCTKLLKFIHFSIIYQIPTIWSFFSVVEQFRSHEKEVWEVILWK